MVGIFSRLSSGRSGHRRTQSAIRGILLSMGRRLKLASTEGLREQPFFFQFASLCKDSDFRMEIREPSQPNAGVVVSASSPVNSHGIEISSEFKPVEHPTEPLDYDEPVKCPLPEPSIINDGRIWKERMSASARVRSELPIVKESPDHEIETTGSRTRSGSGSARRVILPSVSAPEHNLINLLEEYNAA